ncbi:MAG: hypothetical protein ACTIDN_09765 [Acetobacter sp.]|uniref:hypothetical protein n=1 Tax=Acetobacter sp. TaxID=440 RepID=UPI003F908833
MTDKPTGVFVRLPLSEEQLKNVDRLAQEISENNSENEWRFHRHYVAACEELITAIGNPVTSADMLVITILGTLRDPVPCVRQSDALAKLAEKDAEIARLREILSLFTAYESLMDAGEDVAAMEAYANLQLKVQEALKGPES